MPPTGVAVPSRRTATPYWYLTPGAAVWSTCAVPVLPLLLTRMWLRLSPSLLLSLVSFRYIRYPVMLLVEWAGAFQVSLTVVRSTGLVSSPDGSRGQTVSSGSVRTVTVAVLPASSVRPEWLRALTVME